MSQYVLVFRLARVTKNYNVYKQEDGFNQLYLPKGMPEEVSISLPAPKLSFEDKVAQALGNG